MSGVFFIGVSIFLLLDFCVVDLEFWAIAYLCGNLWKGDRHGHF
jgi:hypothetical protein